MLTRLRKEADQLEKSLIEIAIYSEGSISWTDAMMMSNKQRQVAVKTIGNYHKQKAGKPVSEEL